MAGIIGSLASRATSGDGFVETEAKDLQFCRRGSLSKHQILGYLFDRFSVVIKRPSRFIGQNSSDFLRDTNASGSQSLQRVAQ
jgi:hypothetical protein